MASGADDGVVRVWDISTGRQIRSLLNSRRGTWAVRFSPDGKILAAGCSEHAINLWSIPPLVPLRQYLAGYRFANLDLIAVPGTNLYGDAGFLAQSN